MTASRTSRASGRVSVWVVVAAAVIVAGAALPIALRHRSGPPAVAQNPTTAPATRPATAPAAKEAAKPKEPPPFKFIDVVRANVPTIATTQPLPLPLDLPQAAHLIIKDPLYIDSHLNLWVTRPEAPPTPEVLGKDNPDYEYLVREPVVFVHWMPDEKDVQRPRIVTPRPDGGYDYVTANRRVRISPAHEYRWAAARAWEDKILVPSRTGVSVFRFTPEPVELYQDLLGPQNAAQSAGDAGDAAGASQVAGSAPGSAPATAPSARPASAGDSEVADLPEPQILYDGGGFLAWIPWERGKPGGHGTARFVLGEDDKQSDSQSNLQSKWVVLDSAAGWPDRVLHLIPLLGGSVMELIAEDGGRVRIGVNSLGGQDVDRKQIEKLVADLDAGTQKVRDDAFDQLARFGPRIRPMLRELIEDQPPEAQARLRLLMREQVQPLLGPMSLLGDKLQLISRHKDGGAVFYAEAGVSIPSGEDTISQVPAWLAIRPGRTVYLLPAAMTADAVPGKCKMIAVESHDDDWVVVTDARGPRRFVGNALVNLVRKEEAAFTDLVGVDRRGRWLFRKPGDDTQTLVLDPTVAEPRLPVWNYTTADEVGWDKDNWPAIRQFDAATRLKEDAWEPLNKDKGEELLTRPDQIPSPSASPSAANTGATTLPATTMPATMPATQPGAAVPVAASATRPATAPALAATRPADAGPSAVSSTGPPADDALLVTADGTRYYGGVTDLRVVSAAGGETTWALPPIATGKAPAHLVRTKDGRLYLFNQPGRVLRIKPTPGEAEAFAIEATFTRNIPSVEHPTRIWLDPAGRIIMAYDKQLAIMFPSGYIPPALRLKIVDSDDAEGNP